MSCRDCNVTGTSVFTLLSRIRNVVLGLRSFDWLSRKRAQSLPNQAAFDRRFTFLLPAAAIDSTPAMLTSATGAVGIGILNFVPVIS